MLKKLLATTAVSALLVTGALAQSNTSETENMPSTEQTSPDQAPAEKMEAQPAEEAPAADEQQTDEAAAAAPMDQKAFLTEQTDDQIQASRYIGQTVYNRQEEAVGDINDLIFTKDGGVDAAVIGVGGFLGIGEKQVAMAFDAIEVQTVEGDEYRLIVDGTKEQLEAAPEFVSLAEQQSQAEAPAQQQEMQQQQSGTLAPTNDNTVGGVSGDTTQSQ